MSTETAIHDSIGEAASTVAPLWPVHSFVTANPLAGYEDHPFEQAVARATETHRGRGYPEASTFRQGLEDDRIDPDVLESTLAEHGFETAPGPLLDRLEAAEAADTGDTDPERAHVDRVLTKWLSAFLGENTANWSLPSREAGFYAVFRQIAGPDSEIPDAGIVANLPESPIDAIEAALQGHPAARAVRPR